MVLLFGAHVRGWQSYKSLTWGVSRVPTRIFKYCLPDRVLSSTTKKNCLLWTTFRIRCNSSALNCSTVHLQVVSDGKLWPMSQKRFWICLLLSLYKGISTGKMPWSPFPQNRCHCSLKTFAKCGGLVVQICSLAHFGVWTFFDDYQSDFDYCTTIIWLR